LNPALAIEVFHNFTLLHDDIMDKSEMRRNQPTVHVKWDENRAILSGDVMLIKAYQLLAQCDSAVLKSILDVFSQTSVEVCEGQQFDMEFESRNDVSIDENINMIRLKTAVLLAGSLKIGAICGGASEKDADLLYQFGIGIGIAFQLKDDYLDVYGDPAKFGKNIGGDICCNKKTFLLINALEKADLGTKAELLQWINAETFDRLEKIKAVTSLYDRLDIRSYTENAIQTYYEEAIEALRKVSVSEENKKELFVLAENLLYRES
jgi:geranylgeranyl diphosphate synthase type II